MPLGFLSRVIDWLREGYPGGIPARDTFPILAVLRHRLTDEQIVEVTRELRAAGMLDPSEDDVAAAVARLTLDPPSQDDLQRVIDVMIFRGFPDAQGASSSQGVPTPEQPT